MADDKKAKQAFMVIIETPPDTVANEKLKDAAETVVRELLMPEFNMKELSHKDSMMCGLKATEFVVEEIARKGPPGKGPPSKTKSTEASKEKAAGKAIIRVVVSNRKFYVAIAAADDGMPPTDLANGFFDNFELLK